MSPQETGTNEATGGTFWSTPQRAGVLISDLSRCEPQSAVSAERKRNCWYTVSYETRDGIEGVMLGKGALASPPDVSLTLEPKGWHAIYLGVFRGHISTGQPFNDPFMLKVKLSDERLFDTVRPSVTDLPKYNTAIPGSESGIEEFLWKASDLDGQDLVLSYPRTGLPTMAQLAFVRLVPMTEEEVQEHRRASGSPATRVLAAELDGHSGSSFGHGVQTVEDLLEIYEPLRDTDVGKLFLETGWVAGSMFYPTKVGEMRGSGEDVLSTERDRRIVESLRSYISRGIDPVKVRVEYVQSMGIDVYLGFRLAPMASVPPSWEPVAFWRDHPELRCVGRKGNTVPRLSMAYPEVRKFYVDLFLELVDYGAEGVHVIYTRWAPFVLFEPPVIEDFKKEYGLDPRELPDDPEAEGGLFTTDERLERHWAKYLTTFMRELRQALDARQRRDGSRLGLAANVLYDAAYNRAAALDLETWAREGLVDILLPATSSQSVPLIDYDYFRSLTEGTSCVFYADIFPRQMPSKDYIEAARRAYEGGAAGLSFWDSDRRIITKSQWNTVRRLGHRDDLAGMAQEPDDHIMHPLKRIEDWGSVRWDQRRIARAARRSGLTGWEGSAAEDAPSITPPL